MSDQDIQNLRVKIIKGVSASNDRMVHQKIKTHSCIAIMQDDCIKVLSPRTLLQTTKKS